MRFVVPDGVPSSTVLLLFVWLKFGSKMLPENVAVSVADAWKLPLLAVIV